jgi:putative hydrolase of the HAD superfamily
LAIRAVGFDYLGVLTQTSGGVDIYSRMAAATGLDAAELSAGYHRHNLALQKGELSVAELWTVVAQELGAGHRAAQVIAAADTDAPPLNPAMMALVDRVRAAGYKTGLLSNLSGRWLADLRATGFEEHFDAAVYSAEIQAAKPDPRAFQALATHLQVPTDQLVFIDDRSQCLEGVERLGITPILFTDQPELERQLAALGIKP